MFLKPKFLFFLLFFLPAISLAQTYGSKEIFFIDPGYDLLKREKVLATNVFISEKAYFFVEDDFWFSLSQTEREFLFSKIKELAFEFDFKIYPNLTKILGSVKTGVNKDPKITILFHRMSKEVGGYCREADNFEKILTSNSNERKMIYLNTHFLKEVILRSFLAHEFTHLIIFDQKENKEERWLQEIIAEISPTILGYSENLNERVETFKKYFKDPILEWKETNADYAVLSIFSHYLLDQFGPQFFREILKIKETGILAIEKITQKSFSEIFRDFALANYLNNCQIDEKYCYKNPQLKNLKIVPEIQFLPITGESILTLIRQTKDFSQNFYQFFGGKGNLKFEFEGRGNFDVTLIFCSKDEICKIHLLPETEAQTASLLIPDFTQQYDSFSVLIFSKKATQFTEKEAESYNYLIRVSFSQITSQPFTPFSQKPTSQKSSFCKSIEKNLKYGMRDPQVACLQEILRLEGPEIYPEGLVTGFFGSLTLSAVKRFQQKYWKEILAPWGLSKEEATGFVGKTTRMKLNQILTSIQ